MNEDLTSSVSSPRMRYLQEFISEHKLHMKLTKPTFVNSKGVEVSTIDYFLYDHDLKEKVTAIEWLDAVSSNVSDLYPIKLSIQFSCERVARSEDKSIPKAAHVNWKKVNKDLYAALVQELLACISTEASAVYDVDKAVQTVNQVLAECAEESAPKRPRRPRKAKLKAWTPQIVVPFPARKQLFTNGKQPADQMMRVTSF